MARRKRVDKVGRANGMGTVYQLAGKRRKPWVARVTLGSKIDGDRVITDRPILGYYETKEDAERALQQYSLDPTIKRDEMTLGDVYSEWVPIHSRKAAEKTMDSYKYAWNHLSALKDHNFRELRTGQIQLVIDTMDKKGLSRDSLDKVKILAGLLYKYGMQNDIVEKNYAQFVSLPKQSKKHKEVFTELDIRIIEKNVDNDEHLEPILILLYTGLRVSELLDLTPFNIHLDSGYIVAGGKTKAGTDRTIPIHPKVYKYLKNRLKTPYIVVSPEGKKLSTANFRNRYYYPALERVGLPKKSPHICRHTFATMLSDSGADTKSIQSIMGHTNYALTANVYTHKNVDELKKAVNLIQV